jgi:hypothetical protein
VHRSRWPSPRSCCPSPTSPGQEWRPREFRDGFCDHIVMVAGRCVAAPGEVVVTGAPGRRRSPPTPPPTWWRPSPSAAARAAGHVECRPAIPARWPSVRVYRPRDPADPYWGRSAADLAQAGAEPVLADRPTIATCDHEQETQEVVTYAQPGDVRPGPGPSTRCGARSPPPGSGPGAGTDPLGHRQPPRHRRPGPPPRWR